MRYKYLQIELFLLAILLCFLGCNEGPLTPDKYAKYIKNESNGLKVEQDAEYKTVVQYKPPEFLALVKTGGEISEDFESLIKDQEGFQHYNVGITLPQKGKGLEELLKRKGLTLDEYQHYLSFRMQNEFKVIQGNDTLPCLSYHHESGMGFRPEETFVIAFEEKDRNMNRSLLWNSPILSNEIISVEIEAENINNIPKLKY